MREAFVAAWYAIRAWRDQLHAETAAYLASVLEHLCLFAAAYIIGCLLLYALIVKAGWLKFQRDVHTSPKRILFVTAHPDDETMFFGPTLLHFTKRKECSVYLMCLSTGKNYGMGKTRRDELYAACKLLGVREECILIINHSNLPDAMNIQWPVETIAHLILHQIETYDIDTLITFDKHGISRHLNHCSIYYAIAHLSTSKLLPDGCRVYVLETINLLRKYWLLLDIPICYILSRIRFISSAAERRLLYEAMERHRSQFVWFRRLYMYFSRYQLINTLQLMDKTDIELDLVVDD